MDGGWMDGGWMDGWMEGQVPVEGGVVVDVCLALSQGGLLVFHTRLPGVVF